MLLKSLFNLIFLVGLQNPANGAAISQDVTKGSLKIAYGALQQWYNISNGLWIPSTGWWNSANCMSTMEGQLFMMLMHLQALPS